MLNDGFTLDADDEDDDNPYCEFCGDERPCECDVQLGFDVTGGPIDDND